MPSICPVCSRKWGKALSVGCCVCTGDVSLIFKPPGTLAYNPNPSEFTKPEKPEEPKIRTRKPKPVKPKEYRYRP